MTSVPQRRRPTGPRGQDLVRDPSQPTTPPTPAWVTTAYFVGGMLAVVAGAAALMTGNNNILGGLIVLLPLFAMTTFIARQIAEHDNDPWVATMVLGAFVMRMIGAALRYWMALACTAVKPTPSNTTSSAHAGRQWRAFSPSFNVGPGKIAGTNYLRIVTGIVYTITPMSRVSGFMVFGFLSFIGSLFYWRGFRIAFPTGEVHKYALLVLLFPSLVFWPSTIGKDLRHRRSRRRRRVRRRGHAWPA